MFHPTKRALLLALGFGALITLGAPGIPAARAGGPPASDSGPTSGEGAPANPDDPTTAATRQAWQAAGTAMRQGPVDVHLNGVTHLALPKGYGFVPPAEGRKLMEALGNRTDTNFLGLVFPIERGADDPAQWLAELDYVNDGHIADDDARQWKADDLLKSLKEGTEEGNKFRLEKGVKPLEITGWVEPPAYDAVQHRLVWSMAARDKGTSAPNNINYNTYVLGREGYVSLDMITDPAHVGADKLEARKLLAATAFQPGQTYADYNQKTDRLAEYGLAALVGGVVLKKAGVLALLGALAVKFFKLAAVAVLGLLAAFRKWFGARRGTAPAPVGSDVASGPRPGPGESGPAPPGAGVRLDKD